MSKLQQDGVSFFLDNGGSASIKDYYRTVAPAAAIRKPHLIGNDSQEDPHSNRVCDAAFCQNRLTSR